MKGKNGFTLVELLAVIIILGLLMVIIVPKVTQTLKDAEKNTNMTSAENLVKAATLKATNNEMTGNSENIKINYTTGENQDYIDYTGDKPTDGQVAIKSNGEIAMAVRFGDYCYLKSYNSNDITTIPYTAETCDENANVFINYTMPELAVSGDGLYEAQGEPGRYVYRGTNPNNYINLKENGTDISYRIISYEPDGTIKIVRDERIDASGNIWDGNTARQNANNTYCNSANGCNVWGNQSNTYYNDQTLSELNQDFYFYYYSDSQSTNFSIKPQSNYGTVTQDSSLNTYLNTTWINTLDFKNNIETHSFDVGGLYYTSTYTGGNKGIIKEKQEEKTFKWNGKIGLLNITEYTESSTNQNCKSVYSNYYSALDSQGNLLRDNLPTEGWPCKNNNFNYKNYNQWSISSSSNYRYNMWYVPSSGNFNNMYANSVYGVRPAFYLKSSVRLSGLGTSDSPYELVES